MRYENDVYNWLIEMGFDPQKQNRSGYDGDDLLVPLRLGQTWLSIEVKNQRAMQLSTWVDQAVLQAGEFRPVVFHKRRGKGNVGDHYVSMRAHDFACLVQELVHR